MFQLVRRSRCSDSGFTLVEVMVVVTIISILVALAIAQYQDYRARAKFVELIDLARPCMAGIEIYLQANDPSSFGTINSSTVSECQPATGRYGSAGFYSIDNGRYVKVSLTLGNSEFGPLNNKRVFLYLDMQSTPRFWQCQATSSDGGDPGLLIIVPHTLHCT